jgi:ubiquitin C-terminal hydrolase
MFLLDALHEAMCREVHMNITYTELNSEKQKFHFKSLESWKQSFEKHYSPLVNMYFGQFHVQIICDRCKNVSNRWETFNTLKGVIEKNTSISPSIIDCILGELNEEEIEEYSCDTCSPTRTKAVRKTKVWKLPDTLIVVLKRFTYDGNKIHTSIEPFNHENMDLKKLFYENSPNKKYSNYSLRSVIDHHGSSMGGHYTAQAKHRKTNTWYQYDDQDVRSINTPYLGNSSYIFFFEKC